VRQGRDRDVVSYRNAETGTEMQKQRQGLRSKDRNLETEIRRENQRHRDRNRDSETRKETWVRIQKQTEK